MINIEKGKQLEQIGIDERNRRESERLSRSILDNELQTQEEIMQEYDQSSYNIIDRDYYSTVYMASGHNSDNSLSEIDVSIVSTPIFSQIQSSQLQNVNERVHTPARIFNYSDQTRINDVYP